MRDLSFFVLIISIFFPVFKAFRKPEELYQLPFLYSITISVYIIPTLLGIRGDDYLVTDTAYARFTFFTSACFWASVWGYRLFPFKKEFKPAKYIYDDKKFTRALFCFMSLSFIVLPIIGNYDPESRNGGSYAILLYPARLLRPATILLFIIYLLKPTREKLIFLIISVIFSLKIILIDGRRSEVFNLFITIFFPLFLVKGKMIPRVLLIPGFFVGIFIVTFLPVARTYTLKGNFSQIFSLSPKEIALAYVSADATNEVVEAARNMEAVEFNGKYNYGVSLYNDFVFQYASANILGKEFKQSLLIEENIDFGKTRDRYARYEGDEFKYYLAFTGPAAAFFEFGYWGVIIFFLFGIITRFYYERAYRGNNISHIMFYCIFSTFILMSLYHSILAIPTMIILFLVVYIICKRYARIQIRFD